MNDESGQMRAKEAQMQAFRIHISAYLAGTILLFILNLRMAPDHLVVVWPLLAWGVLVALHAARVMDLLPSRRR